MNNKPFNYDERPNFSEIYRFVDEIRNYLFAGYFELANDIKTYKNDKIALIKSIFENHICKNGSCEFVNKLTLLEKDIQEDLTFFLLSDPAAENADEVIYTYPGFLAIIYYRVAHILYKQGVKYIPRIITEKVHSLTGIDIHPGAEIGCPFFIDHGTGIVIGQTAEIGHHVKIYHGVTLGALSLEGGHALAGTKRHPTIKDFVTIYSGASILGGETIIGSHVTIGSNVFIVNSVLENTKVVYSTNEVKMFKK